MKNRVRLLLALSPLVFLSLVLFGPKTTVVDSDPARGSASKFAKSQASPDRGRMTGKSAVRPVNGQAEDEVVVFPQTKVISEALRSGTPLRVSLPQRGDRPAEQFALQVRPMRSKVST